MVISQEDGITNVILPNSINYKNFAPPLLLGGPTFPQNNHSAYQYHLAITTHVECVVLIEKK